MKVKDVYVLRNMLGTYKAISKEEAEETAKKGGYGNFVVTNQTQDGELWDVTLVFPMFACFSQEHYNELAEREYRAYREYLTDITGITYDNIDS